MTERPILFSAPMVRAILDGRKTQTRRPINHLLGHGRITDFGPALHLNATEISWTFIDGRHPRQELPLAGVFRRCPYGCMAGDRLWVRETFGWGKLIGEKQFIFYKATNDTDDDRDDDAMDEGAPWKPSIHMPRCASRITLEITGVRIQPLNEISRDDAMAEGIQPGYDGFHTEEGRHFHAADPRKSFAMLWEQIHGNDAWDANPWVWAIDFKRVQP
ncbi:MAG TPA: hypothetical protein DCW68_07020 [Rhodospirillaceae bacterium]|nr:hypothetical protein [Rhodospirillaceae bacterium]